MTPEALAEMHEAAKAYYRAEYARKRAAEGLTVRPREDLTGWTPEEKRERQRRQTREAMRRKRAAMKETRGENAE